MTDTTKHPGMTIVALLLLAATVDWMASVIFGGAL